MGQSSERFQLLTWAEFDDFWRELEASHEDTPYTFDAYDEEVARIAFKAGRESMRRHIVAMVEHMLELRRVQHFSSRRTRYQYEADGVEIGQALLREIADDVSALVHAEDN